MRWPRMGAVVEVAVVGVVVAAVVEVVGTVLVVVEVSIWPAGNDSIVDMIPLGAYGTGANSFSGGGGGPGGGGYSSRW